MANTKSAIKEIRVADARRVRNKMVCSRLKTSLRKSKQAVSGADYEMAKTTVASTVKDLDKAVSRGVIHRNTAARSKSRLVKKLNKMTAQKSF